MLKKLAVAPIHEAAKVAWAKGDRTFVRKFYPSPTKQDRDLAEAIDLVTAAGWALKSSDFEGTGLSRHVNLIFVRP